VARSATSLRTYGEESDLLTRDHQLSRHLEGQDAAERPTTQVVRPPRLRPPQILLDFDDGDAKSAGQVRATLEKVHTR
jgi:hypothetical protein